MALYENFSLSELISESLSLLLENHRSEKGSKGHSQGVLLLFVIQGRLYFCGKTSVSLKNNFLRIFILINNESLNADK